jgi:hypothetical protein
VGTAPILADPTLHAARIATASAGNYKLFEKFVEDAVIEAIPVPRGE